MPKYAAPATAPTEQLAFRAWVLDELSTISTSFSEVETDTVILKQWNAEPAKLYDGLLAYADGSNWNPGSGEGLYSYYNAAWKFLANVGDSGEANTASNVGTDGVGVFDAKVSDDLQFRNVAPGSAKISVTLNGKDIDIDIVPTYLTDAPSDGSTYGRKDAAWAVTGGASIVKKIATADQDVSSTTPADHNQLKGFVMAASKLYSIRGEIWAKAQFSSGGFKWTMGYNNIPTAGEFFMHSRSDSGLSGSPRNIRVTQGDNIHNHDSVPNFAEFRLEINCLIRAHASGTVMDWQFGQFTSSANAVTVFTGSWLTFELLD